MQLYGTGTGKCSEILQNRYRIIQFFQKKGMNYKVKL